MPTFDSYKEQRVAQIQRAYEDYEECISFTEPSEEALQYIQIWCQSNNWGITKEMANDKTTIVTIFFPVDDE